MRVIQTDRSTYCTVQAYSCTADTDRKDPNPVTDNEAWAVQTRLDLPPYYENCSKGVDFLSSPELELRS